MVRVEIAVCAGRVVVLFSDDGDVVQWVMSADECREFANGLGEAILRLTRVGVMA